MTDNNDVYSNLAGIYSGNFKDDSDEVRSFARELCDSLSIDDGFALLKKLIDAKMMNDNQPSNGPLMHIRGGDKYLIEAVMIEVIKKTGYLSEELKTLCEQNPIQEDTVTRLVSEFPYDKVKAVLAPLRRENDETDFLNTIFSRGILPIVQRTVSEEARNRWTKATKGSNKPNNDTRAEFRKKFDSLLEKKIGESSRDENVILNQLSEDGARKIRDNNEKLNQWINILKQWNIKIELPPLDKTPSNPQLFAHEVFKAARTRIRREFFKGSLDESEAKKQLEEAFEKYKNDKEGKTPMPTPLEILTDPAYFETSAYSELRKYCGDPKNGVYVEESLDFVKFYHEYAEGEFENKTEDELRAIMDVFLNGEKQAGFGELAKSEIYIETSLKYELQIALGLIEVTYAEGGKKIVTKLDPPKTMDKQKFKEGLQAPYTEVMGMLTPDENLKKVKLSELSAPKQPVHTEQKTSKSSSSTKRSEAPPPQQPKSAIRRFGSAVAAFFKNGLSIKAARNAFNEGRVSSENTQPKPPKVAVVEQTFEAVKKQLADFKTKIPNDLDKQAWAEVEAFVQKQQNSKKPMATEKFFKELKNKIEDFYQTASLPKEPVIRGLVQAGLVTREDSNTQQEKVANENLEKALALLRGDLERVIFTLATTNTPTNNQTIVLTESIGGDPLSPNMGGEGSSVQLSSPPDPQDVQESFPVESMVDSIDIPPLDQEPLPDSPSPQSQEYTNFFKAVLGNAYEYAGKGEWKWNGEGEGPCGKYSPKLLPAQQRAFDEALDKGDRIAMKQANEGDPKKWTFVPPEGVKFLPPPPPRMVNALAAILNNSSVPAVVPPSKPDGVDLGPPYNTVSFSSAGRGTGFFQNRSSPQEDSPENSIKKDLKDVLGSVQLEGPGLDEVIGAVKMGERFLNGTATNVPEVISGILDEINKVESKGPKLEEFEGKLKGFQERLDQVKAPESRSSNSF
jgi:hypothetical protein